MSTAPRYDIDPRSFADDPYPALAAMREACPIAFVPQFGATLFTRRDDIAICEKNVAVFSSDQPGGLMNRLMGQNMMRKDGEAHAAERRAIFPTVSPKTVRDHWRTRFEAHCARILDDLAPRGAADLVRDFAMPVSAEALKEITGLVHVAYADMDAWSQAMIDGIANYGGDPEIEARCNRATAAIDAAIDERLPAARARPDPSLLGVMAAAEMPEESIRANIKLAISGGQNEPRDAIAGLVWALLNHPDQLAAVRAGAVGWLQAFEEYARWLSPIGMSPRRIAQPFEYGGVAFETDERVFFMFGAANRDPRHFADPDRFDVTRDVSKSIAFGAGPHFCAGAWASRTLIADVAVPALFERLKGLRLASDTPLRPVGWAFRGLTKLPVAWEG